MADNSNRWQGIALYGVGIAMIDPKLLENFNNHLSKSIGESLDSLTLSNEPSKQITTIYFGKKFQILGRNIYDLKLALVIDRCTWHLWHDETIIYTHFPHDRIESTYSYLESLKNTKIADIEFDPIDLSLRLIFDNNISFRLIHSKEDGWHYSVFTGYQGLCVYDVENETIKLR